MKSATSFRCRLVKKSNTKFEAIATAQNPKAGKYILWKHACRGLMKTAERFSALNRRQIRGRQHNEIMLVLMCVLEWIHYGHETEKARKRGTLVDQSGEAESREWR